MNSQEIYYKSQTHNDRKNGRVHSNNKIWKLESKWMFYKSCFRSDKRKSCQCWRKPKTNQFTLCVCLCWVASVMSNSLWLYGHSPPGSSVHGILQARILELVAMPFSRRSSCPRDPLMSLISPALADEFFTTNATWEAQFILYYPLKNQNWWKHISLRAELNGG